MLGNFRLSCFGLGLAVDLRSYVFLFPEKVHQLLAFLDPLQFLVIAAIADRDVELLDGEVASFARDQEHPALGELVSISIDGQTVAVSFVFHPGSSEQSAPGGASK